MPQPFRNEVQSNNDWTMAAVGLCIILTISALFFREIIIEGSTLILYEMWKLVDFPGVHDDVAWRINVLASTHNQAETVSWFEFFSVMDDTAGILLMLMVPMAIGGIVAVRRHQISRTCREISIQTLPRIMSTFSPSIIPALTYGDKTSQLLNVDPKEHRSAQTPEEFAIEHKLVVNRRLHREKTAALFINQLGKPLSHEQTKMTEKGKLLPVFSRFNDHERAMFAIFGLQHFLDKRKEAEQLLDALNRSTLTSDRKYRNQIGYPNLSLANNAFKQVATLPAAKAWIRQHRYIRTAIAALHDNDLHLPIRRYRWLKGLDRTLFYALASTGRPWPFVEAVGVVSQAHWEKIAAHYRVHLKKPIMTLALDGLETDLKNIGAIVDETPKNTRTALNEEEIDDEENADNQEDNTQKTQKHPHPIPTFRPKMR